jgi:acylphosphatase
VAPLVHWHCGARGRVQGVNYRARVAEAAHRHGVVGSVANGPDGTVFIDVQGAIEAVEAFLRDVSGPRGVSHAHAVDRVAEVAISSELSGFEILRARSLGGFGEGSKSSK